MAVGVGVMGFLTKDLGRFGLSCVAELVGIWDLSWFVLA
jgi:hypothetical protein